jgi:hypothetical protein
VGHSPHLLVFKVGNFPPLSQDLVYMIVLKLKSLKTKFKSQSFCLWTTSCAMRYCR